MLLPVLLPPLLVRAMRMGNWMTLVNACGVMMIFVPIVDASGVTTAACSGVTRMVGMMMTMMMMATADESPGRWR